MRRVRKGKRGGKWTWVRGGGVGKGEMVNKKGGGGKKNSGRGGWDGDVLSTFQRGG